MQHDHASRTATIAEEVRRFYTAKRPFRIYHGSTNSTRIQSFKRSETIDISRLNRVIEIDTERQTALVEPNMPMDALVKATLQHGLIPKVVMEFPGITVGGGIQGGAGESSSFRYGCFNQICNRYEMILGDGSQVNASPNERSDLFYGTAGAFGTLGIITAAEVQLMPAKKYVQLTYQPVDSFKDAINTLQQLSRQDQDYIDGIMFDAKHGVIITGSLTDQPNTTTAHFRHAWNQWYYLHAQTISDSRQTFTETVPLTDYLFRYDRGAFWVGRLAFELFGMPFNRFTRWLFNPVFHTRKLYEALHASGASQQYIVQDLALPQATATTFMDYVDREHHIYPLWLCPLKPDSSSMFQSNNINTPLIINVGVWGSRITEWPAFVAANRSIEKKVAELGGKKWFYAHSYYEPAEFWSQYDQQYYDRLRQKYHATTLPDIYSKIHVSKHHSTNLKRGALRTMWGLTKLRMAK